MRLALRPFAPDDLALLRGWLDAPHVRPWYPDREDWLNEAKNEDGSFDWIHHFIIECDHTPVGFCQYYDYRLGGEDWHGDLDTAGLYSIDYLVGEPQYLKRGVGRAAVCALIDRISRQPDAEAIVAQPEARNAASRALLIACGFAFDEVRKLYRYDLKS